MLPSPFFKPTARTAQLGDRTVLYAAIALLLSRVGERASLAKVPVIGDIAALGVDAAGIFAIVAAYFLLIFLGQFFFEATTYAEEEARLSLDAVTKPEIDVPPELEPVRNGLKRTHGRQHAIALIIGRVNQILSLFVPLFLAMLTIILLSANISAVVSSVFNGETLQEAGYE